MTKARLFSLLVFAALLASVLGQFKLCMTPWGPNDGGWIL